MVKTTLSLTIDGTAQADVAKAIADYGLTLEASSAVESQNIAANGEVTLNVKANATSAERKITLTLKHNTTVLATTEFTQEAGEGGAACAYTYDLGIVNKNGFGYPAVKTGDGNWAYIRNIARDGKRIDPITEDIANEVLPFAYRAEIPTDEDLKAINAPTNKKGSITAMTLRVRWCGGTQVDVTIDSNEGGCITKFVAYNPDGTEFGHFIVWTD